MTKSALFLGSAAIAALIGAMAVTTIANSAEAPSSPEDQAADELNRKIAEGNAAEEARAKAANAQYDEQLKQYEEQKRAYDQKKAEYDAQVKIIKGAP